MSFLHRPKLTLAQGPCPSRTQAQDKASAGHEPTPSHLQPKSQARSAPAIPLEQNLRNHPTLGHGDRVLQLPCSHSLVQFRPPSSFALTSVHCTPILSVPTLLCVSGGTNETQQQFQPFFFSSTQKENLYL